MLLPFWKNRVSKFLDFKEKSCVRNVVWRRLKVENVIKVPEGCEKAVRGGSLKNKGLACDR